MNKHTPGPWTLVRKSNGLGYTVSAFESNWAEHTIVHQSEGRMDEGAANASLIAAAPDLLAAAQLVLAGLKERIANAGGVQVPVFDGIADLSDAINKATMNP